MKELETYADLLGALQSLSVDELKQPIQTALPGPNGDEPVELCHAIAIGTVGQMGFAGARSTIDNRYHADEVVLLVDWNPHAADGAIAYEWSGTLEQTEERPLYGKEGPTPRDAQMAPVATHDGLSEMAIALDRSHQRRMRDS